MFAANTCGMPFDICFFQTRFFTVCDGYKRVCACCSASHHSPLPVLGCQAVARGRDGPLGNADHAALKPALRTLVRGLERGQAETLWILYLRLFAILPGKEIEAIGMVEHALE